jgi:hypothetical protein
MMTGDARRALRGIVLADQSGEAGKRGCSQRNQVTFTKSRRCNNSSGENFAHDLKLVGIVKHLQLASKGFAH